MQYGSHMSDWGTGLAKEVALCIVPHKTVTTYLGIFELLLNLVHEASANLTNEGTKQELRTDLTCTCYGSTDAHQGTNLVRPEITNTRDKG